MKFEFTANQDFNFLKSFAEKFDLSVCGNKLIIPDSMGEGSIKRIDFAPDFKLLIHNYTFNEEFILKRNAPEKMDDMVLIIFYSTALPNNIISNDNYHFTCTKINNSAIEISSNDLSSEIRFPPNTSIFFTVVGIKASTLHTLINPCQKNNVMESIVKCNTSFLFHENMWADAEKILKNLPLINELDPLHELYFRIKVQELIYLVFSKLLKRKNQTQKAINNVDVEKMFAVRTKILSDLSMPPKLAELAKMISMSETKMKMLFKQIFGDTIYNYYQQARMEEAAFLLKQTGYSVSEVGYRLGFSNLSHFSRLFQKHYEINPKRYTSVG